jgi:hypothetical protein
MDRVEEPQQHPDGDAAGDRAAARDQARRRCVERLEHERPAHAEGRGRAAEHERSAGLDRAHDEALAVRRRPR